MKNTILQLKALALVILFVLCFDGGAWAVVAKNGKYSTLKNTYETSDNGFEWKTIGPDNVGGAVRAVVYDRNDTRGLTIYAGCTNGGLFITKNGGTTWEPVDTRIDGKQVSLNISCMVQGKDNILYIGTGCRNDSIGSLKIYGKGIYKLDGNSFSHVENTDIVDGSERWNFINNISVTESGQIWAATNTGVLFQNGSEWVYATSSTDGMAIYGNASDIMINKDKVFAYIGNDFFIGNVSDGVLTKQNMISQKVELTNNNKDRIYSGFAKMVVANNDDNIIYVMLVYQYFRASANVVNTAFYISIDNGNNWSTIVRNSSTYFAEYFANQVSDGYALASGSDGVLAIDPTDDFHIFFGHLKIGHGKRIKTDKPDEFSFGWLGAISSSNLPKSSPYYVHDYQYSLAFNPFKSNEFVIGSIGGLSKGEIKNDLYSFKTINRGLNITDVYNVSYTADGSVLAGTYGNGLQYFDESKNIGLSSVEFFGNVSNVGSYRSNWFGMSALFPNVMYVRNFLSTSNAYAIMRTESKGTDYGGLPFLYTLDPIQNTVNPFLPLTMDIWESYEDTDNIDSITYTPIIPYKEGESIWLLSNTQRFPLKHTFEKDYGIGETFKILDVVSSKAFCTSLGSESSFDVYLVRGIDNFKIDISSVKMANYKLSNGVYMGLPVSTAVSTNGNSYYIFTRKGFIIRFSNLKYAVDENTAGFQSINNLVSNSIIADLLKIAPEINVSVEVKSISVDPTNEARIIITFSKPVKINSAEPASNIFICENTFDVNPVFSPISGIEDLGILSSMFYMYKENEADELAADFTNKILIGTTQGLYFTDDLYSGVWNNVSGLIGNVPITDIKQQKIFLNDINYMSGSPISPKPAVFEGVKNYLDVYIATFGNGVFRNSYKKNAFGVQNPDNSVVTDNNTLKCYPNPVINKLNTNIANDKDVINIELMDISGRTYKVTNFIQSGSDISIDTDSLPSGIYVIKIVNESGMYTGKFIKL